MQVYGPDPTYQTNLMYASYLLDQKFTINNLIYISRHVYENVDSYWPFAQTFDGLFYQIENIIKIPGIQYLKPDHLYQTQLLEYSEKFFDNKEVYSMVDFFGDIGGHVEIIMFIACSIIQPISYHSYLLKTM